MSEIVCFGRVDHIWIILRDTTAQTLASMLDPAPGTVHTWRELLEMFGEGGLLSVHMRVVRKHALPEGEVQIAPDPISEAFRAQGVCLEAPIETGALLRAFLAHDMHFLGQLMLHDLEGVVHNLPDNFYSITHEALVVFHFASPHQLLMAFTNLGCEVRRNDALISRCLGRPPIAKPVGDGPLSPQAAEIVASLSKALDFLRETTSLAGLPANVRLQPTWLLEAIYDRALVIWNHAGGNSCPRRQLVSRRRWPDEQDVDRTGHPRVYGINSAYHRLSQVAGHDHFQLGGPSLTSDEASAVLRRLRAIVERAIELYEQIDLRADVVGSS